MSGCEGRQENYLHSKPNPILIALGFGILHAGLIKHRTEGQRFPPGKAATNRSPEFGSPGSEWASPGFSDSELGEGRGVSL